MGFWTLFEVASMPIIQVLLISGLGALMATPSWNLLTPQARRSLNKVVFAVFTPSLMFASLAKSVTLDDIVSWWFMPVNIAITFLIGGILGWIVVKILRPNPYLEGLIIATCASGNLGNLLLIIVPAMCHEQESPFGDRHICTSLGLSYASFSMALGGFFIWTYAYQLIRQSSVKYKAALDLEAATTDEQLQFSKLEANRDVDANELSQLLNQKTTTLDDDDDDDDQDKPTSLPVASTTKSIPSNDIPQTMPQSSSSSSSSSHLPKEKDEPFWKRWAEFFHQLLEELLTPPTLAAIVGFVFGAVLWLKNLIIGDGAPLRVIQDSINILGDGTIPCITLILGGNLVQGLQSSTVNPLIIVGVVCVRYMALPLIGILVVRAAASLGLLPSDPLFQYILMIQFTLPPAMNIGTMTQLFDVAQEECSVMFLWTYLIAAPSLTAWSTVYMWILS